MVDMESSYLTVDFFRRLPQEVEKGGSPTASSVDRYTEGNLRRIGSNVSGYILMVSQTLRNTIPKAVVYCQVREAKQSLLDHFYAQAGKKEVFNYHFRNTIPAFLIIRAHRIIYFQNSILLSQYALSYAIVPRYIRVRRFSPYPVVAGSALGHKLAAWSQFSKSLSLRYYHNCL